MQARQVRIRPVDGPGHIVLRETGDLIELVAGNVVLLSSAALGTERDFGRLVASLGHTPPRRILVGGLGFGATLRGVLEVAGPDARIRVVEKVDAVVALVQGPLAHIAQHPLEDERVELVRGDVSDVIAESAASVDAILLDVDNGPHWASFRRNARLYAPEGLRSAKRALVEGGALAVWSGYRSDPFLAQLRAAGFTPSVVPFQERGRVRARAYVGSR
ncbi:MAG: spermidine synthase [Polyangiaceae bacterium]